MRVSTEHIARTAALALGFALIAVSPVRADDYPDDLKLGLKPDAAKGYDLIMHEPMAAQMFQVEDIDRLWNVWEPEEKAKAEAAEPQERRRLTFERYGWVRRPEDGEKYGLPLGYTEDGEGAMVTNCFSCHGGKVAGVTIPGVGNTHIDMTTLATDMNKLKLFDRGRDHSKVKDMMAPFKTPLNYNKGFTNAVIFAPVVGALRDPDYARMLSLKPEILKHHNMNPPAWWLYKYKTMIYSDAFAPKTPRQLMPFAMSPTFTEEKFRSFEPNFVHISEYIERLEAPKYPFEINREMAAEGKALFEQTCARCHGTYGENASFPNEVVPIDEIGTDKTRYQAIIREMRERANTKWLQYEGKHPILVETPGYLAQPLEGIWASAPYFHNGAAPTLWAVLNPSERPKVWKRTEDGYDTKHVGLEVETFDSVPEGLSSRIARMYYDTDHVGNSAAGHTYPDELDRDEKVAVMEYLKTL